MASTWTHWTREEDNFLRKHYKKDKMENVVKEMNALYGKGRTTVAGQRRAQTLGLTLGQRRERAAEEEAAKKEMRIAAKANKERRTLRHIKMHFYDYHKHCDVCGAEISTAFTVIRNGKKKTYCQDCYNTLIELPRIRDKVRRKRGHAR